ncbi:enoyl-CoA hydratase/isomerase family protein [Nocardia blacklockiae]|uniref:enoyl-CoA hydratase/isomerase family protein n=1 Tax=Nocardia blacklockiae TaxID=480036 RepID=UPI001894E6B0|nr:enoyl-CoA hydratase/isomerase family protein [Nocardia blacklockiae]MBF6170002.1 enoyl-CoA hydratase/isomerase family protein [Nocardia blacklockiae]
MNDFTDLDLRPDGQPGTPLVVLEPDPHDTTTAAAVRLAAAVEHALPLVITVLREPPTPQLRPLLSAATLTLIDQRACGGQHQVAFSQNQQPVVERWQQVVVVPDVDEAVERLRRAVAYSPRAAVACGQLLRQTVLLPTMPALAAEAAVYSTLLGGSEFGRWLDGRRRASASMAGGPARPEAECGHAPVRLRRSGGRLSITLDRARRRNALSAWMREELLAALQLAELDPSIESVELSGDGPAFCSGGDLDEFGTATDLVAAYLVRLDRAPWAVMDRIAGRLTARVHGACIGAGAEMASFAGTVIAAPDTIFRFPELTMGLIPGAGGTVAVPRRIGRWRAAWLMLTGESLPAPTAVQWGLADRLDESSTTPLGDTNLSAVSR